MEQEQPNQDKEKQVKPAKPKSFIWNYFDDCKDGEHSFCKPCNSKRIITKYKCPDCSTKSLRTHLEKAHKAEWLDMKQLEKKRDSEGATSVKKKTKQDPSQPTILQCVKKLTKVDPQGAIQKKYDRLFLELIGCNFLAFRLADSPEWKKLIEHLALDKSINLKHSTTYSKQMEKYSLELLGEIMKIIHENCDASIAITTDLWTSRVLDAYISITTLFVDEEFMMHRWTPFCSMFEGQHTGDNIQEVLDESGDVKLKLPSTLPMFGTSDNAANMIKALAQSKLDMYGCNNHTQQLAIQDAFKEFKSRDYFEEQTLLDCSNTAKRLATHLHKSSLAKMWLDHECEKTGHSPNVIHQANETRWDSRCDNMEDVVYHEECLMRLARKGKFKIKNEDGVVQSLIPTILQFRMMKGGVKVLKINRETTKIFEQEKTPTIPFVVEKMYNMDKEIETFIKNEKMEEEEEAVDFAKVLREKLQERFKDYGTDRDVNSYANYLNPTLKGVHLKLLKKFDETKEKLEESFNKWKEDDSENVMEQEEEKDPDNPDKDPLNDRKSPTEMLKEELKTSTLVSNGGGIRMRICRSDAFSEPLTEFQKECKTYEILPYSENNVDLLEFWKIHQKQFPILSYLVRVIFPIPAASSKSERVFSISGSIVSPRRTNLKPEKVENLVLMKCNLNLLNDWKNRKNTG